MNASTTKQKLVIVLQGIHDSGKTTTLNLLIQLLLGTEGSSLLEEDRKNLKGEDRRVLISYQGKKVYVGTPGDVEFEIWKNIALSEIKGCDILVTAARSKGATKEAIIDYAELINAEQAWIQKRKVEERIDEANRAQAQDIKDIRDEANEAQAQELKDRIDAFIKAHP
nr:hypothetical protein [uncultured Porphyromonas sp.]